MADALKLQQAIACHRQGRLVEAEALYGEILTRSPAQADALHWLGMIRLQQGDAAAAAELIARAVEVRPADAAAHASLGSALRVIGRPADALAAYDRALLLRPDYPEALANRGIALRDLQRHEDALASLERALALRPSFAEALYNRGNALRDLGRAEAALASYDEALALRPSFVEALANRGNALQDLRRHEEAVASYDGALALRPELAEAHFNRGNALLKLYLPEAALAAYDSALALKPASPEVYSNRGNALRDLKRYPEALRSLERALALAPGLAEAHFNRGCVLRDLGDADGALASHDLALEINPGYLEALVNRGNALQDLKRHDEALASFERAQALAPGYASAHFAAATCRLLLGDFERGWSDYEWRWRDERPGQVVRTFAQPLWTGGRLDGTLLAWGEQGVGDQILHLTLLPELTRLAQRLIVALDARLLPLVRRSFPQVAAIALDGVEATPCDAQVPLGSLAQHFRRGWDEFPHRTAPSLRSDDTRRDELRGRIAGPGEMVCGLSWVSTNVRIGRHKSIALSHLAPLLELPGVRFIDLQYGDTRAERESLPAALQGRLARVEDVDNRDDIDGLAALIGACDVVVTVSNTTAHLAGALGRPVLLMLPHALGRLWYWHEDRADSPWYPGMRLFRAPARGDWASVIQNVRSALAAGAFGHSGR